MSRSIEEFFRIHDKVVLITGAGGGFGREFARALSGIGAKIVCWDVDGAGLDETKELIHEGGIDVFVDIVDVGSEDGVKAGVARANEAIGRVDVLINNAGISTRPIRVHELATADWDRLVKVNLTGTFLCSKHVLPGMLEAKAGSIINISSVLGKTGFYPSQSVVGAAYSASKAGVDGFTRQLASEYARDNIRCNSVAPSFCLDTNLGKERRAAASQRSNEQFASSVLSRTPLRRFGTSEDLLGLVIYLASESSRYVTGQTFALDGGWTAT